MKKKLFLLGLLWGSISTGCKNAQTASCIDPAKVDNERACLMIYEPVCGCDGQTYDNSCVAESKGLISYQKGACPTPENNSN